MRSEPTRSTFVRDARRNAWIAICPNTEFIGPLVTERRAGLYGTTPPPTPAKPKRRLTLTGADVFVLTLIASLYSSLIYCLTSIVR
jgi:hypothetical protein